jgi:hypothetical protein
MRWNVTCLTLLLCLVACSKRAVLNRDGVGVRLTEVKWKAPTLSEGTWKVGRTWRDTVSKTLTIVQELPLLDSDDVAHMESEFGIDSWLIRVVQSNAQGSRIELITLYSPFMARNKGRASGVPVKAFSFNLTYAAWAISERFRRFQCPAFSHDRRLDEYEVIGGAELAEFPIAYAGNYEEKLKMNELVPSMLNVGNTMVGEYHLEAALFSSTKKQLYSSFIRIPVTIKVAREKTVSVEGCAGVHQEYEPRTPDIAPVKR